MNDENHDQERGKKGNGKGRVEISTASYLNKGFPKHRWKQLIKVLDPSFNLFKSYIWNKKQGAY